MIQTNKKAGTIKSYISAIRAILLDVKVELKEDKFLLSSLTKACKLTNDHVRIRLPIKKGLLFIVLKAAVEFFGDQPYLATLYQALIPTAYFRLFRVGELTLSPHVIKARDVQIGKNKNKLLFILRSSKTHCSSNKPQMVKIQSIEQKNPQSCKTKYNCPFTLLKEYLNVRGPAQSKKEQFFVFSDGSPVTPHHMRTNLKALLSRARFQAKYYDTHSLRIGRATDLLNMGISVETIKKLGRWKSNAVFNYLR